MELITLFDKTGLISIKIDKLSGKSQDLRKWVDTAGICPPNISGNQELVNPFLTKVVMK